MDRYLDHVHRSRRTLLPLGAVVLATLASATACGDGATATPPPSTRAATTTTPRPVESAPAGGESMPGGGGSTPGGGGSMPGGGGSMPGGGGSMPGGGGSMPGGGGSSPSTAAATPSPHTGASTPSSSAGDPRCTSDRLRLSLGRISPGAGNIYVPLVFTNTGTTACHLLGFPGVSLLSASGARIGEPAQREGDTLPPVVLAPGKAAYASVHTVNEGVSDKPCRQAATWVQAYPPGSTEALRVPADSLRICGATFDVTALRPGQHP
ncbi:DUF4232 domain-containing protein [Streptomyces sp. NPDC048416]|uniref:DUF4232 domain-containing protein n=1 Tax=Streptomyces sp. NPDC048416 TaxID=3365546 RepID=UPI003713DB91